MSFAENGHILYFTRNMNSGDWTWTHKYLYAGQRMIQVRYTLRLIFMNFTFIFINLDNNITQTELLTSGNRKKAVGAQAARNQRGFEQSKIFAWKLKTTLSKLSAHFGSSSSVCELVWMIPIDSWGYHFVTLSVCVVLPNSLHFGKKCNCCTSKPKSMLCWCGHTENKTLHHSRVWVLSCALLA